MADAPEVVPGSLTPDSIPAISPAPIAQASRDERSPSPPYHQAPESSQIRNVSGEKEIREPDRTASDEKEFLKFNESTIKYPIDSKAPREPDRTTPMYAAEEQDRNTPKYPVEDVSIPRQEITGPDDFAGCRGIDSGGPEELSPTEQRRANTEDGEEWHNSLWGCCSEGSRSLCECRIRTSDKIPRTNMVVIGCEVSFMPCILAGRRYLRVKNTKPNEMTSTNIYVSLCSWFPIKCADANSITVSRLLRLHHPSDTVLVGARNVDATRNKIPVRATGLQ
jgi:hypothetical protein